jgi:hypothetical protein
LGTIAKIILIGAFLIKHFFLLGGCDGEITDVMLNDVIRAIAKKFGHNPVVAKRLIQEFAKHGATGAAHPAVLLK